MRPGFFRVVLGVALVLTFQVPGSRAEDTKPGETKPAVSAAEALTRLKDGNARFVAGKPATKDLVTRRTETAKGQKPFAIILTCADSRVSPELLFDQGIGDVFVQRVAGNVTDPVILGSIEYAVEHLHAPLVIVLGHEKCGAVGAIVEGGHAEGNLAELLKRVHVGEKAAGGKDAEIAAGVRANARFHAAEMMKRSTTLKDYATSGRIQILAGVYAIDSGKVEWLAADKTPEKDPKKPDHDPKKPDPKKPDHDPKMPVHDTHMPIYESEPIVVTDCPQVIEVECPSHRVRRGLFGRRCR